MSRVRAIRVHRVRVDHCGVLVRIARDVRLAAGDTRSSLAVSLPHGLSFILEPGREGQQRIFPCSC